MNSTWVLKGALRTHKIKDPATYFSTWSNIHNLKHKWLKKEAETILG